MRTEGSSPLAWTFDFAVSRQPKSPGHYRPGLSTYALSRRIEAVTELEQPAYRYSLFDRRLEKLPTARARK
jgi:hypothetical protein